MNSLHVLLNRVKKDYLYQIQIWKSVLDWTIMLYILIPAVVAAVIIYRSWWLELPSWSSWLSLPFIASAVYITLWIGTIRFFVKEADGIFYLKHRSNFIGMKKWAFLYALLKTVIGIILLIVILLPLLVKSHSMNLIELFCLLFYWIGLALFIRTLHLKLRFSYSGWKQKLLSLLVFIIFFICNLSFIKTPFSFLCVSGILLTGVSMLLIRQIINTTRFFEDECLLENEQKLRFVTMIFGLSPSVEKPRIIKRKRPWMLQGKLFRKRNAQNGFNELFLKIFIRNFTFTGGYFRLVAITAGAIVLLPPILKAAIGFGFCFFINIWMHGVWDKIILANPIGKRYNEHPQYYRTKQKTAWYFTLLAAGILFIVYTLSELFL